MVTPKYATLAIPAGTTFSLRSARHLFFTHLHNEGFATDARSNADSTAVLSFLEETADAMEHSLRGQKEGTYHCYLSDFRTLGNQISCPASFLMLTGHTRLQPAKFN